jgi:hypothetical protein
LTGIFNRFPDGIIASHAVIVGNAIFAGTNDAASLFGEFAN